MQPLDIADTMMKKHLSVNTVQKNKIKKMRVSTIGQTIYDVSFE